MTKGMMKILKDFKSNHPKFSKCVVVFFVFKSSVIVLVSWESTYKIGNFEGIFVSLGQ
jgi:hypothetical protein